VTKSPVRHKLAIQSIADKIQKPVAADFASYQTGMWVYKLSRSAQRVQTTRTSTEPNSNRFAVLYCVWRQSSRPARMTRLSRHPSYAVVSHSRNQESFVASPAWHPSPQPKVCQLLVARLRCIQALPINCPSLVRYRYPASLSRAVEASV
jgi:hypothetical protein